VAVDAADAGQPVAEPFGLGDLGHAVFDQPGLMAVPQVVEVQPAHDCGDAGVGVAVGGGSPVAAVEAGAAVQAAVATGEHVVVVVAVDVGAQQLDQERRQQDVAYRGRG